MHPRVTIHMTEVPKDLPMVHAFSGFVDAGHSIRQAVSHMIATLPHQPVAELTIDDIYEIRRLHSEGKLLREVSERFHISTRHVRDIANGRTWVKTAPLGR